MRRILRLIALLILGILVGVIGYEAIMAVLVFRLRSQNPSSTSLIETRSKEAQEKLRNSSRL